MICKRSTNISIVVSCMLLNLLAGCGQGYDLSELASSIEPVETGDSTELASPSPTVEPSPDESPRASPTPSSDESPDPPPVSIPSTFPVPDWPEDGDWPLSTVCEGMAQIPELDEPTNVLVAEVERISRIVDHRFCPWDAVDIGRVIGARAVPQEGGAVTLVWAGFIDFVQPDGYLGRGTKVFTCVTIDTLTGAVLDPGVDLAADDAALAEIERAADYSYWSVDSLRKHLSLPDKWGDSTTLDAESCLWEGDVVVNLSIPWVMGGWRLVAFNGEAAQQLEWIDLTGGTIDLHSGITL